MVTKRSGILDHARNATGSCDRSRRSALRTPTRSHPTGAAMTAVVKLVQRTDADTFLRMLGGRHTFLTFGEGGAKGKPRFTRPLHGTLAEHAETLAGLNARGAGVFVMVNEGDSKGRKATNVQRVRALFVDLDGAPLEPVILRPAVLPCRAVSTSGVERWDNLSPPSSCVA